MDLSPEQRRFLRRARVGRLATADPDGRPAAVPVCYALLDDRIVTPVDEKPKTGDPTALRRLRDVRANPRVALVVDRYAGDWDRLAWLQVRGTATVLDPTAPDHSAAVTELRGKYDQYADHALDERPVIRIDPGHVRSWGSFSDPGDTRPRD